MRRAHRRDGAALSRFLHWLDEAAAQRGSEDALTEIEAAERLAAFREQTGELRDLSFDTIAGAGPHGAIVHYRVSAASNRPPGQGELFLLDSGRQYPAGTTYVPPPTPTGRPRPELRRPPP